MKDFFARIAVQARDAWKNLTSAQRIWAATLGGGAFVLLLAVIFMAQRTVWVELGTFEIQLAAQIKVELDNRGYTPNVHYKIVNDGRTIMIDAKIRNEALLGLGEKGLYGHAEKGFAIFNEFDITTTDYEQRLRTFEALKSEMRRMIRTYTQVADVSISVPRIEDQSIFIESEIPQTAAVVITLHPGTQLDDEQIRAIRGLIAGGFPGLTADKITLTDQFMRELKADDEEQGRSTKQTLVVRQTARSLEDDIRRILGPVLGNDKFTVSVNVEFDWDNVRINQENYSVPGFDQLKVSEQTEDERLTGQGIRPGGEPGVAANAPPVYQSIAQTGPIDYSRAERIVNYLADKTVTERIRSPFIKRISAAVAVDGIWQETKDTEGRVVRTYQPREREAMDHFKALVQSALGHNLNREDVVEVRNVPWDRTREFERLDALREKEEFRRRMMLYGLLSAPLLVGLLFLYAAWRRHVRLREEEMARERELERQRALAAAEAGLAGEISLEDQERQEIQRRAISLAWAKPKVVADLVRTWMAEDTPAA